MICHGVRQPIGEKCRDLYIVLPDHNHVAVAMHIVIGQPHGRRPSSARTRPVYRHRPPQGGVDRGACALAGARSVSKALRLVYCWADGIHLEARLDEQAQCILVIELVCLAPSVGLSQPWRFILVDDPLRRAAVRRNFVTCNAEALAGQEADRAAQYARLKLAGLDDAPCHLPDFADRDTARDHGLGRQTMPQMSEYSAVGAVHTLWLAAWVEGIGMGWVSILDPRTDRCRP